MKKQFAILLSVLLMLCACQKEPPIDLSKFQIVNQNQYVIDGKKCMLYRMTVSAIPTDEELFSAMNSVLNDGYYLHTIGFYNTIEETKGVYTIAMIAQESDGTITLKRREPKSENIVQKE